MVGADLSAKQCSMGESREATQVQEEHEADVPGSSKAEFGGAKRISYGPATAD